LHSEPPRRGRMANSLPRTATEFRCTRGSGAAAAPSQGSATSSVGRFGSPGPSIGNAMECDRSRFPLPKARSRPTVGGVFGPTPLRVRAQLALIGHQSRDSELVAKSAADSRTPAPWWNRNRRIDEARASVPISESIFRGMFGGARRRARSDATRVVLILESGDSRIQN